MFVLFLGGKKVEVFHFFWEKIGKSGIWKSGILRSGIFRITPRFFGTKDIKFISIAEIVISYTLGEIKIFLYSTYKNFVPYFIIKLRFYSFLYYFLIHTGL